MAKESNETIGSIIHDEINVTADVLNFLFPPRPEFDAEASITQMLENNVGTLDALRVVAFDNGMKERGTDVRLLGHAGTALLAGYEDLIDYRGLVSIINSMKAGIARRRTAAIEVLS